MEENQLFSNSPMRTSKQRTGTSAVRSYPRARRPRFSGIRFSLWGLILSWDEPPQAEVAAENLATSHSEGLGLPEESLFSYV